MTTRLPIEEKLTLQLAARAQPSSATRGRQSASAQTQTRLFPREALRLGRLGLICCWFDPCVLGPKPGAAPKLAGHPPGIGLIDQTRLSARSKARFTDPRWHHTDRYGRRPHAETTYQYPSAGIPASAYPKDENIPGCGEAQYLLTPDGVRIDALGHNEYFPVPGVNRLTPSSLPDEHPRGNRPHRLASAGVHSRRGAACADARFRDRNARSVGRNRTSARLKIR